MAFVKVLKNKAFFKRYQVPKKRRYQGKTDYQARVKMIRQDKCKFNSKKYRLIVRITNSKVICQIAYATIIGDMVVAQANSQELAKFGVPCGHTNYAAAYCTGLLVARRILKVMGMDDAFKGKEEINGEEYHVEDEEAEYEGKPFKAILDVGLQRTCAGARMWGALKGAVDGGVHVPHNTKNFPGYSAPEEKGAEGEYDAEAHKDRIFGKHVSEYMSQMQEEDETKYEAHFAKFIANSIDADGLEGMYEEAHKKIRENPGPETAEKKNITTEHKGNEVTSSDGKSYNRSVKLTLKQRRVKVQAKISAAQAKLLENDDD